MKVSVAMTTYNGELYLIEQLDSLREQEMKIDQPNCIIFHKLDTQKEA